MDKCYDAQGNTYKVNPKPNEDRMLYYCAENPILQSVLSYEHIKLLAKLKTKLLMQDNTALQSEEDRIKEHLKINSNYEYQSKKISDKIHGGVYKYMSLRKLTNL